MISCISPRYDSAFIIQHFGALQPQISEMIFVEDSLRLLLNHFGDKWAKNTGGDRFKDFTVVTNARKWISLFMAAKGRRNIYNLCL